MGKTNSVQWGGQELGNWDEPFRGNITKEEAGMASAGWHETMMSGFHVASALVK